MQDWGPNQTKGQKIWSGLFLAPIMSAELEATLVCRNWGVRPSAIPLFFPLDLNPPSIAQGEAPCPHSLPLAFPGLCWTQTSSTHSPLLALARGSQYLRMLSD